MLKVVVAIVLLLGIVLIKKIPYIGGNIHIALLIAGAATMICAGMFTPQAWLLAFIDGLNRISWITCLALTGGIFAEISNEMGTVDTTIGMLNAKFGRSPRALIISIILVLTLAGSLLGDACAAATVIGALTIGILCSMGISPEKISAIIVMGASIGSIMPPHDPGHRAGLHSLRYGPRSRCLPGVFHRQHHPGGLLRLCGHLSGP